MLVLTLVSQLRPVAALFKALFGQGQDTYNLIFRLAEGDLVEAADSPRPFPSPCESLVSDQPVWEEPSCSSTRS
jgi:hypothetical protein